MTIPRHVTTYGQCTDRLSRIRKVPDNLTCGDMERGITRGEILKFREGVRIAPAKLERVEQRDLLCQ